MKRFASDEMNYSDRRDLCYILAWLTIAVIGMLMLGVEVLT